MKLISFDIGIKNLSYCILESETKRILDWGIIFSALLLPKYQEASVGNPLRSTLGRGCRVPL